MAYNRNNAVKAYLSNDSDYRAWWDAIRAQFTAIGLVQTSDTGQLNPASHTRPTTNSFSGYEVWRWADTLQASLAIYMRIRPGVGAAQDRPAIEITVGTSTNGAGTINGQAGTAVIGVRTNSKTAGDTLPSFMSHGEGYFHFFTNVDVNSANYAFGFIIERPFSNGAPTAEGILHYTYLGSAASNTRQVIPPSGTVPTQVAGSASAAVAMWPQMNGAGQNTSDGTNFATALGTYMAGNGQRFTCAAVYNRSGDLSADLVMLDGSANPKVTMWGQSWTYLAIGDALNGSALNGVGGDSLMIRAE